MEKIRQSRCAYRSCNNDCRVNKSIRYFYIPSSKDESRRQKWIRNCGNEFLNTLSENKIRKYRVCEIHFEDHCFTDASHWFLTRDAVPIPFITPPKSPELKFRAPIRTYSKTTEITGNPSGTAINVEDIKLENEDEEVSESQFHFELQKELPLQEQQSDKFSNLCRSCAKQNAYLIPIDVMTSIGISVNAIFNEIGLTISDDDEFPKKICETCLDEIILVYKFYEKILNSKSVFERLLLEENYSEPVVVKEENDACNEKESCIVKEEEDDDNNLELMQIDEDDSLFECFVPKVCSICGTNQLTNEQMLDHKLSQHVPVSNQADLSVMTCPYCKTEFSIMLWYNEHLKKCLGQSKPNCIVCKLSLRPKYLDNHLEEWHMLEKINSDSFRCIASESCTYFSSSVLMLNEHQMAEHDRSLYVCIICGSDYIASQKLLVHRRTHEKRTSVL